GRRGQRRREADRVLRAVLPDPREAAGGDPDGAPGGARQRRARLQRGRRGGAGPGGRAGVANGDSSGEVRRRVRPERETTMRRMLCFLALCGAAAIAAAQAPTTT